LAAELIMNVRKLAGIEWTQIVNRGRFFDSLKSFDYIREYHHRRNDYFTDHEQLLLNRELLAVDKSILFELTIF
jgi:hypothetical protein